MIIGDIVYSLPIYRRGGVKNIIQREHVNISSLYLNHGHIWCHSQ